MSKTHELCIRNEELCIKNEELCIRDEELCIKNEELCIRNEDFCHLHEEFCRRRWEGHWPEGCERFRLRPDVSILFDRFFDCFPTIVLLSTVFSTVVLMTDSGRFWRRVSELGGGGGLQAGRAREFNAARNGGEVYVRRGRPG